MGLGLYFVEGEGPKFERPLRSEWEIRNLSAPDPTVELAYVLDAVRQIRRALDGSVPLIGFSGSLDARLLHGRGGSERGLPHGQDAALHAPRPDAPHPRSDDAGGDRLPQCPDRGGGAGGDALRFLGGVLAEEAFKTFSLPYLARIVSGLRREAEGRIVPSIVFTKGGGVWLEDLASIGADAVGLDWTMDIGRARTLVGDRVALQGNLDPAILFAPPDVVVREACKVLEAFGHGSGHVFNLGHGISQHTPPEHVAALVHAVQTESVKYHQKA